MASGTDTVRRSDGYQKLVATGLVSYGLVHLMLAYIALHLAFTGGGDASQQGAFKQLAQRPLGVVLLWTMAVGLLALCLWQLLEATVGRRAGQRSPHQLRRRMTSLGRAMVYLVLGVTAARVAMGAGSSSGGNEEAVSARLLRVPFGRFLLLAVGIAVIAVGVSQVVKGVRRKFRDDLAGPVPTASLRLGTVGYCAKGVALVIVGLLFGWAAWAYDPKKAGGMDAALSTLRDQPFGAALLVAVALGIASFGLYCFYWARHAKY